MTAALNMGCIGDMTAGTGRVGDGDVTASRMLEPDVDGNSTDCDVASAGGGIAVS